MGKIRCPEGQCIFLILSEAHEMMHTMCGIEKRFFLSFVFRSLTPDP